MLNSEALQALTQTLEYSRGRDYEGHSKHDALNSPLLNALTLNQRLLRLVIIQSVMRAPFNCRGFLGVPRLRNPKGIGLFAHSWLNLSEKEELQEGSPWDRDSCLKEADRLLTWLVANASPWAQASEELCDAFSVKSVHAGKEPGLNGMGWGYHYPWQDVGFFQERHFPNRVVTSWIGMAFLKAYEVTGMEKYRLAARELVGFLLVNPNRLHETEDQLCLSYVPLESLEWAVMDVSVLVSSVASRLRAVDPESNVDPETVQRLLRFVVDKQTADGAWFYTYPSGDSHITHDNYHTGIILDAVADTMLYSRDFEFAETYRKGLDFYQRELFTPEGAPKWMNNKIFPHDIHGAAAGILAFRRAERFWREEALEPDTELAVRSGQFADLITRWTLKNLYSGKGTFYYQKSKWYTKRTCLMRWCNAWMCRALTTI
jgi:hypothetical protein